MNCKKNANSNPGEERQLFHPESEKVVEIGLERLRPFKNHKKNMHENEMKVVSRIKAYQKLAKRAIFRKRPYRHMIRRG